MKTLLTLAFEKKHFNCLMVLLDHGTGTPADASEHDLDAVLQSESEFRASEESAASMLLARVSAASKAHALGVVLRKCRGGFSASSRAAFMLLAHGADIDATDIDATAEEVSNNKPIATYVYATTHFFIKNWHEIALNALSIRVEVDRRVGLGLNGLYQEPLERVLQYLGLSIRVDQVVNSSLDDLNGTRRALLPNCARNANHWFQLDKLEWGKRQNNNKQPAA
jgi:hypothetical protein